MPGVLAALDCARLPLCLEASITAPAERFARLSRHAVEEFQRDIHKLLYRSKSVHQLQRSRLQHREASRRAWDSRYVGSQRPGAG